MGPVKAILPFIHLTTNADDSLRRSLATTSFFVATIVVVFAALIGKAITAKWGVSPEAVAIAGGVILFIWSLQILLRMQNPPPPVPPPTQPTREMAVTPLTLPTIISPAGIAVILYFTMTRTQGDWHTEAVIIGLLMAVMVMDLLCLIFAESILRFIGGKITLLVLGSVLAVVQNALAAQILIQTFRKLI